MDSEVLRRAEQAFVEYLVVSEGSGAVDFEALCARHPDLEPALRELRHQHERILELVARTQAPGPTASLPPEADPRVTLQEPEPAEAEVLQRIWKHAPKNTRYEIHDELARGGMGVVFKAWDPGLRRRLAMKTLLSEREPEGVPDRTRERMLVRFVEEAQITGQLEHPGIMPVHDLGLDPDGRVFFTMPLVRGRDFKSVIKQVHEGSTEWTFTKALRVIMKVCEAVAYAHSRGVIHRDLKPANVMVGRFGETYVMDWGLARVMNRPDSHDLRIQEQAASLVLETGLKDVRSASAQSPLLTHDGSVIGTPAFMAPEQARGRIGQLDGRTDVYSIGRGPAPAP